MRGFMRGVYQTKSHAGRWGSPDAYVETKMVPAFSHDIRSESRSIKRKRGARVIQYPNPIPNPYSNGVIQRRSVSAPTTVKVNKIRCKLIQTRPDHVFCSGKSKHFYPFRELFTGPFKFWSDDFSRFACRWHKFSGDSQPVSTFSEAGNVIFSL